MSVINYGNRQSAPVIRWAVEKALFYTLPITVRAEPEDLKALERYGIKPRGIMTAWDGDERVTYLEYGPLDARLLASAIIAANIASYNVRYGEDDDPGKALDITDKSLPPEKLRDGVMALNESTPRLAWSVLSRVHYNILPEAVLGEFARRAIERLMNDLAHEVMFEDPGL